MNSDQIIQVTDDILQKYSEMDYPNPRKAYNETYKKIIQLGYNEMDADTYAAYIRLSVYFIADEKNRGI